MKKVSQKRFILVTRKTRLQELIERFNTWPQAKFYLEHNDIDAQDYLDEHDTYQKCLVEAERVLKPLGRFQQLDRVLLPNYQFGSSDIVVVVGQDGLVANTLKYLKGQPVIAINPDPARWDGKLLPFEIAQLKEVVMATLADRISSKSITFAEATTNDGQRLLAVNDLFIGPKTHTSAYYTLNWNGVSEAQSSSGVIISTGFGSTGWFQS
ncbi:MAG TPA: sugar kinase, partial [Leucothrix mucor]|nr:sugar kinase [Leucothrix mucor]